MTEQIRQDTAAAETAMGLDEAFRFIGELARQSAQGDEAAKLLLEILKNQQVAEIRNLELELQILNTRALAQATLQFMALPNRTVE